MFFDQLSKDSDDRWLKSAMHSSQINPKCRTFEANQDPRDSGFRDQQAFGRDGHT
jgi:hypothetical protein